MKRNIFIRILCLLLCVSMVMPITASAAGQTPLYTYPTVTAPVTNGYITNPMAYVDRFFDEYGRPSPLGDELAHWLDMEEPEGGEADPARKNSGYLMLEQEMIHQDDDGFYQLADFLDSWAKPVADTIASKGVNLVFAAAEEAWYISRFGKAGKSAYPYYQYFCDIYMEYVAETQAKMEKIDKSLEKLSNTVVKIAKSDKTSELLGVTETDSWILVRSGKNLQPGAKIKVAGVDAETKKVKFMYSPLTGKNDPWEDMPSEFVNRKGISNLSYIDFDVSALDDVERAVFSQIMGKGKKMDKTSKEIFCGMNVDHIQGFFAASDDVDVDPEFKTVVKNLKTYDRKQAVIDNTGKVAAWIGTIDNTRQYFQKADNATAQQLCYINAVSQMTDEYLQMLTQWRDQIDQLDKSMKKDEFYESVYDKKSDIVAGLDAVIEIVAELGSKTVEELANSNQRMLTSGDFLKLMTDWAEKISGITGLSKWLKETKTYKELKGNVDSSKLGSVAGKVGDTLSLITPHAKAVSTVIGLFSNGFGDFDKATESVSNLKKSLYYLLTNEEDGLLKQYWENRCDETAWAVINALKTMKEAKYYGESLWEAHYLMAFCKLRGIGSDGKLQLIFQNELAMRKADTDLDISKSVTSIVAVCEDDVQEMPSDDLPDKKIVSTKVLGFFNEDTTEDVFYDDMKLTDIPAQWKTLPRQKPNHGYHVIPGRLSVAKGWEPGKSINVKNTKLTYIDENAKLYSCNGIEVLLTGEQYERYLSVEHSALYLMNSGIGDEDDVTLACFKPFAYNDQQAARRLERTYQTKLWIESFEMYDETKDYIKESRELHQKWARKAP